MYVFHEGEIIIKEKYGSSANERFYVKPPAQDIIVSVNEKTTTHLSDIFNTIFLPQGYPDSVSKDYLSYQIWDTAQCFCSTVTGILATQEVLRGVGVGDTTATPLAATITWVIKDGCGHMGRILFAYSHGSYLDAYSKKWRLYADTLNDAAMCLELALPLFKKFTTPVLCISTVLKSIVGVAGGATRAAMTQHHAIRGNMADVSAKDSAQETAVNLIASLFAIFIISMFRNPIFIFVLMMIHHIAFNYLAVRAVCLKTLNEPRFLQVIYSYVADETIAAPCEINRKEPLIFYQLGTNVLDLKLSGFKIRVGESMKNYLIEDSRPGHLKSIQQIYEYRNYILLPNITKRKIYVILKDKASTSDVLCGYFHAVLLAVLTCAINDFPLAIYKNNAERPFAKICESVNNASWAYEDSYNPHSTFRRAPSLELMEYLDKVVEKEWHELRSRLLLMGWDLSKHLLISDEWRICTAKLVAKPISTEDVLSGESLYRLPAKVITFNNPENTTNFTHEEPANYIIEPTERNDYVKINQKEVHYELKK